MSMATVQFYRNRYNYPDYSESLTSYGATNTITPNNINIKSGTIKVNGTMTDFMNCNYIRIVRNNQTLYAWIDNVEYHTANSFLVTYTVDAFRTWKNKINLGTQYIERSPEETNIFDPLLGSTDPTNMFFRQNYNFDNPNTRYLVVQVREHTADFISMSPGQPSMYNFYVAEYSVNNWRGSTPIVDLMEEISYGERPNNIVTAYSVPHIDLSGDGFLNVSLTVRYANSNNNKSISGWKVLRDKTGNQNRFVSTCEISVGDESFMKTSHNFSLVFPDAGIINIPDSIAILDNLNVKMYVDMFTGACNYILCTGITPTHLSVRGGATTSIPIISDPYDTYISQNQNTLMSSMLGDVANLGYGVATGNPIQITSGSAGLLNRMTSLADAKNEIPSTPPAFLGSALMPLHNKQFWLEQIHTPATNLEKVNNRFGYPKNMVDDLYIPNNGYIKTDGCNVSSTDGTVPKWALEEVNQIFNNGLRVH